MKKIKALLYCTKAKPYLYETPKVLKFSGEFFTSLSNKHLENWTLNGTIVAECEIEVEKIHYELYGDLDWQHEVLPSTDSMSIIDLERYSCLDRKELDNYLQGKNGYALHISNLKAFDKPYKLGESLIYNWESQRIVEKAPQNMCRVYNRGGDGLVLISIQPQWLEKILNGEKTIEVRKQVLNCMKGNE